MPWLSLGKLTHELRDGEVIVGSGSEATWRIPSADLMPRHFALTVHGLNASVRAVSTDNVVVVNGQQLSGAPWTLHDGDVISAGGGRFVYSEDTPPKPTPAGSATTGVVAFLVDDRANSAYRLASRSTGIGRDKSNAVVIRDPTASRFHAEIRREAGGFVLHARGSAGTTVNNRRVAGPYMLDEGDQIEIAYTVLRFTIQAPPDEQLAAAHAVSGSRSLHHRRPTPVTDRMPRSGDIEKALNRGRSRLGIAIALILAIALWLWLR